MGKEETLLITFEVAARLGVSSARVRQLADAGKLPQVRTPSGHRFYRLADVERLAEARLRAKAGVPSIDRAR
jgi:excisionase family DNA binding protein